MNNFTVCVDIEDNRWTEAIEDIASVVERIKKLVIERVGDEVDFLQVMKDFSVNLCLSNDESVHSLNLEFRKMDKPTNVLSFANVDDEFFDDMLEFENPVELGDIIIAYETMLREADEQGISLHDHFCHLWTHGLLHILGYDHMLEDEQAQMEAREIDVLAKIGIENPYRE